ncbi:hypothetical protein IFM12275_48000 [Nocardia sputorum]|uniref:Uncharacterized protein n=1 Tax=Nocardia sputorum TaxID=2984338 RepID=A0ABN6UAY0_9NOCA|nr:hypothetical protein IFM12275_48000 [Nocardia sputorum]BDU01925.1 hypothetical protein IFM12276_49530 [Nocardia sputorum]
MARLLEMGLDVILQFETGMVGTQVNAHGRHCVRRPRRDGNRARPAINTAVGPRESTGTTAVFAATGPGDTADAPTPFPATE